MEVGGGGGADEWRWMLVGVNEGEDARPAQMVVMWRWDD